MTRIGLRSIANVVLTVGASLLLWGTGLEIAGLTTAFSVVATVLSAVPAGIAIYQWLKWRTNPENGKLAPTLLQRVAALSLIWLGFAVVVGGSIGAWWASVSSGLELDEPSLPAAILMVAVPMVFIGSAVSCVTEWIAEVSY